MGSDIDTWKPEASLWSHCQIWGMGRACSKLNPGQSPACHGSTGSVNSPVSLSLVPEHIIGIDNFGSLSLPMIVCRAKRKIFETSLPISLAKVEDKKKYHIIGKRIKISVTLKDLKNAVVVVSIISPFNLPVWSLQKPDGSRRVTMDYHSHDCRSCSRVALVCQSRLT